MMNINFRSQRLLQGYDFLQSQPDSKPIKVLVHEFIQSVVFTPFPQDSELQVERLTLAGSIYESIGFKRKAAFYRRFAALKSVTDQSNWQACYDSLLESLSGFGLTLDPIEYERAIDKGDSNVWPGLHVQLIEELITCCKKMQNAQAGMLAIRHMSFMFHTLDFYLPNSKKRDFAKELEEASSIFGEDSPVPLKLKSGFVVPTVNLTKYPLCIKLEPQPLPFPLRPIRMVQLRRRSMMTPAIEDKLDNPFIFTPIASHSSLSVLETKRTSSNIEMTDITWVQDEPCSTTMVLKNTLPFELNVTSIKLLTDGVPLEASPYNLDMGTDSDSQMTIHLVGVPRQLPRTADDVKSSSSRLEIFGYSTHLLGVKSNCRLDMIPKTKFPTKYVLEIAPPLPRIEFKFPDHYENLLVDPIPVDRVEKDLVVIDIKVNLVAGEKLSTQMAIFNPSNVDVDYLYVQQKHLRSLEPGQESPIRWDDEKLDNLSAKPLKTGDKLDVDIDMIAHENLFTKNKHLTTILIFEYSGGMALQEMYCRKCALRFTIQISCTTTSQ